MHECMKLVPTIWEVVTMTLSLMIFHIKRYSVENLKVAIVKRVPDIFESCKYATSKLLAYMGALDFDNYPVNEEYVNSTIVSYHATKQCFLSWLTEIISPFTAREVGKLLNSKKNFLFS